MKYFYALILLIVCNSSFGQIQRAFITDKGKFSNSPKHAISYLLIKKIDGDSAFSVNQYDMHDTIMVAGNFKDELLTIPNGKFIYYYKNYYPNKKDQNLKVDNNKFIKLSGYYINGKREGKWIEYASRGVIAGEYNYENGKMNGPYKRFFSGSYAEGTMVDDSLQGKYYVYNKDSLLVEESEYDRDKLKNNVQHLHEARERETFTPYLEKALKKYRKILADKEPVIKFTVDKKGGINNVQIVKGVNPEVDAAIIKVMEFAPSYVAANYDYVPIERKMERPLLLYRYIPQDNGFTYIPSYISGYHSYSRPVIYQVTLGGLVTTEITYR